MKTTTLTSSPQNLGHYDKENYELTELNLNQGGGVSEGEWITLKIQELIKYS